MTRRVVIVIALSLLSIGLWAPDVRRAFGHPIGQQAVTYSGGRVYASSLDAAISADMLWHADLTSSPTIMRLRWMRNGSCWMASPGEICDLRVIVGGRRYRVVVPAQPEDPANGHIVILRVILALLWLLCAASLVLLRPSKATWAFFALSLYGWSPNNVVTEVGPAWLQVMMTAFENAWETTIPFAACAFALYLMQPQRMPSWRSRALTITYAVAAAVAVFSLAATVAVAYGASEFAFRIFFWYYSAVPVASVAAPIILLATYLQSERSARQRIRWVLAGFSLGTVVMFGIIYFQYVSYVAYSAAQALYVFLISATTAYAVLRHRIIDVNVVLSRTLVYTLLSAVVVGLFALVDLFFSRTLSESKAGLIADVALALVLGFFMNAMHSRVDRFVDAILFRKRHLAEEHVALVAQSLRHAQNELLVTKMLVDEPVRAFDLVFGALARRSAGETFAIVHAKGDLTAGGSFDDAEALCAYLVSERKALPLGRHFWKAGALQAHGIEASIAVPVFSHGELEAVAFYTQHRNGTELDSDEIALIDRVADAAGAAFDRLEARSLRERLQMRDGTLAATL